MLCPWWESGDTHTFLSTGATRQIFGGWSLDVKIKTQRMRVKFAAAVDADTLGVRAPYSGIVRLERQ